MVISAYLATLLPKAIPDWLKRVLFYAVALLMILALAKCGYDIYHDRQEAKRQTTIGILETTNKNLSEGLVQEVARNAAEQKEVSSNIESKEKSKTKVDSFQQRRDERIASIEKKYEAKKVVVKSKSKTVAKAGSKTEPTEVEQITTTSTPEAEKEKATEVSQAHLDYLWSTYCEAANKSALTCGLGQS